MSISVTDTRLLADLLAGRLGVLERLYCLSQRQLEIVRNGEITVLLDLLGTKQKILGELEAAERRLDPYRDTPPEKRVWNSREERHRCDQLVKSCETALAAILECDRTSERLMKEKKDDVQKELQRLNGRRVSTEYVRQTTANVASGEGRPQSRLDLRSGK